LDHKKQEALILPQDIRLDKKKDGDEEIYVPIKKTAITSQELIISLSDIKAKRTLLLLDSCHSGGFGEIKGSYISTIFGTDDEYNVGKFLHYFPSVDGLAIIASCCMDELSFGNQLVGSFFYSSLY